MRRETFKETTGGEEIPEAKEKTEEGGEGEGEAVTPEKKGFFARKLERAETAAKVLALSAALLFGSPEAETQESGEECEPLTKEERIELIEETRALSDILYQKEVKEKHLTSNENVLKVNGVGEVSKFFLVLGNKGDPVLKYKIINDTLPPYALELRTILYDKNGEKVRMIFEDENADGGIDKIVFNQQVETLMGSEEANSSLENLFTDMAKISPGSLYGKDTAVAKFKFVKSDYDSVIVEFFYCKNGLAREISGKDAKSFFDMTEKVYAEELFDLAVEKNVDFPGKKY